MSARPGVVQCPCACHWQGHGQLRVRGRATRTGEPLGSPEFVRDLERRAGRGLRVVERGRPGKRLQTARTRLPGASYVKLWHHTLVASGQVGVNPAVGFSAATNSRFRLPYPKLRRPTIVTRPLGPFAPEPGGCPGSFCKGYFFEKP